MLSICVVVFREVFEIALIVGVLATVTKGLSGRLRWMGIGILGGVAGALLLAVFADKIANALEGVGQEVLNAAVLLAAAGLIGWTTVWMSRHASTLCQHLNRVGQEVVRGERPLYALAGVVALSVLREGAEIVMFLYSAYLVGENASAMIWGGLLGVCGGMGVGVLLYYGLTIIPTKKIFSIISVLLVFLVAGMVSQAFGYLVTAGKMPEIIPILWDTSAIISQGSFLGQILHVLLGYAERPSGIQVLVYSLTVGCFAMVLKFFGQGVWRTGKRVLVLGLFVSSFVLAWTQTAHATKKVYSPIVEKGEVELEIRGQYDVDDRASKDNAQKHKYALGYGVTDRWFTEIYGEVERAKNTNDEDLDFDFTALSWENRFQLTEQGEFWVDVGMYFEYEASFEEKHPDKIEAKLLLEKSLPRFTHTLNLKGEQQVGSNPSKDFSVGLGWSSKYRLREWLQPGVEWHSDFGEVGQMVSFHDQKHQLGPVFYGKWGKVTYDVGYLFGMSDAAPEGEIKWILEYEFNF